MASLFDRTCPANGKKQFPTALMASLELEHVQAERAAGRLRNAKVEVRAYACPDCSTWHLTSKR